MHSELPERLTVITTDSCPVALELYRARNSEFWERLWIRPSLLLGYCSDDCIRSVHVGYEAVFDFAGIGIFIDDLVSCLEVLARFVPPCLKEKQPAPNEDWLFRHKLTGPSLSLASHYRQRTAINASQTSLPVGVHNKESAGSVDRDTSRPLWYVPFAFATSATFQNTTKSKGAGLHHRRVFGNPHIHDAANRRGDPCLGIGSLTRCKIPLCHCCRRGPAVAGLWGGGRPQLANSS
jgi:hypothetical protein